MRTIEQALDLQADAAAHKVHGLQNPARFTVSGMLGGAYVGIAVVLMLNVAAPLIAAETGMGKLVSGLVFGVALTLVVFAGAELVTSSMMTLTQGTLMGAIRPWRAAGALSFTFIANLLGAAVFGVLVAVSGVLHANPAAGAMLEDMLAAKAGEGPLEMFVRGILCNTLVCLGIWMCARLTSDGAKLAVLFWALLAFVASGYEHVVANMTTYTLGLMTGDPNATWALFGTNILWVGLGNLVGGAIVVGMAYWVVGGSPRMETAQLPNAEPVVIGTLTGVQPVVAD